MYTDHIDYSGYNDDYALTDGVACALPDLRYVLYIGLGAVVVAAALVMALVYRLRGG